MLSSTKGHVWQVSRVKVSVDDMVREREKGQGGWVHGGAQLDGMVWHWVYRASPKVNSGLVMISVVSQVLLTR